MNNSTGGPAFPHHVVCENGWAETQKLQGMTIRDYFAAKAMYMVNMNSHSTMSMESRETYIARRSYAIADAMLRVRNGQ